MGDKAPIAIVDGQTLFIPAFTIDLKGRIEMVNFLVHPPLDLVHKSQAATRVCFQLMCL